MDVIPLGTNGFFSSFGRETACYSIPHKKTLIILDAGTGLFRFAEPIGQKLLQETSDIHLYLSHYHLDHTFGFYAAFKLFEGKKITVFGSQEKKVFKDIAHLDYSGLAYDIHHKDFSWRRLNPGILNFDSYSVSVRQQYHGGAGSLAYRFSFPDNKSISYLTDSEPSDESVKFCKNADILLHEHYFDGKRQWEKSDSLEDHIDGGHTTTSGAALIAKRANVKKLALIHHHPFTKTEDLKNHLDFAKKIFPASFLALDGIPISL